MSEQLLPLFLNGENSINSRVSYNFNEDGNIYYFLYCVPIGFHRDNDKRGFRITTSQLILNGHCKNCEIVRAFGVSVISVKRSIKKLRESGMDGFYKPRNTRKGGTVLTPEVLSKAQRLLNEGNTRSETAEILSLKVNTLSKAIQTGRIHETQKKTGQDKQNQNAT